MSRASEPIVSDDLANRISELHAMLETDDARARSAWRTLRSTIRVHIDPDAFAQLSRRIDAYEYQEAAQTLFQLVSRMRGSGSS